MTPLTGAALPCQCTGGGRRILQRAAPRLAQSRRRRWVLSRRPTRKAYRRRQRQQRHSLSQSRRRFSAKHSTVENMPLHCQCQPATKALGPPNPQPCAASSLSTSAMTSFNAQSSVPPSADGSCDGWMNSSSRQCDAGESDSTSAQRQTGVSRCREGLMCARVGGWCCAHRSSGGCAGPGTARRPPCRHSQPQPQNPQTMTGL